MGKSSRPLRKTNRKYIAIIVILAVALIVSLVGNFKSPYLSPDHQENLGQLTYRIPLNGNWVYGDLDTNTNNPLPGRNASLALNGSNGMVLIKGYVNLDDMTLFEIGYVMDGEKIFDKNDKIKTPENSNVMPTLPACVKNYKWAEKNDEWIATFTVEGKEYFASAKSLYGPMDECYEEFVETLGFSKHKKDEFELPDYDL